MNRNNLVKKKKKTTTINYIDIYIQYHKHVLFLFFQPKTDLRLLVNGIIRFTTLFYWYF